MSGEFEPNGPAEPSAAEPSVGLLTRAREHLSLSRVQAIFGILAALLSIGGALYGYLRPGRPLVPNSGEIVASVRDAKSGKPIPEAALELLTQKDVLVTMLSAPAGEARRRTKEGPTVSGPRTPAIPARCVRSRSSPGRPPRSSSG
jgi:hypothetical protein